MSRDSSVSVFVISVAARLADLHPQTLRNYEREGLIEPDRTGGGNRMYSEDDLAVLARITQLSDEGLNVAGIRKVFAIEAQMAELRAENERLRRRINGAGGQ